MKVNAVVAFVAGLNVPAFGLAADPERGAQMFGACIACHSLEAGDHRTGPSLASTFGREAGTAEGFQRYSAALSRSGVVWTEEALDAWLRDPAAFIPGNTMAFGGLPDASARADLIAYLRAVSEGAASAAGTPSLPDLRVAESSRRVKAITYCGDTYRVALADGRKHLFWEFNLRFKTDSSSRGPRKGEPVIVAAGMGGDRAQVVFAAPEEISSFIRGECK